LGAGLWAGIPQSVLVTVLIAVFVVLTRSGIDVRKWLAQMSSEAMEMLAWELPTVASLVVAFLLVLAGSLLGAALSFASVRYDWGQRWQDRREALRSGFMAKPAVQKVVQYEHSQRIAQGVAVLLLLLAPFVLNQQWNYTLGTVGIYVILGLGLNVVVGMAGLLNLGYAAFFAIGSYTVAMLTVPEYGIELSFWVALPIGIVLAGLTGLLLSLPVLRMRGDYLAIVTLGFGEIIRILLKSDALTDFTGGPRGIRAVGGPTFFGQVLRTQGYYRYFMYLIMLGIVFAIVMTRRLQNSRLGRAWMAMREDEDVAQAMGIYTLQYKVLAFTLGAAFAGLGGVLFASRNRFTGPEDFTLLVSVNVLCLVIIGGMGSVPGIVVGALVLKGLPEVLRQLEDFRMLVFGVLLVVMMIVRPEGLWPAPRRRMELGLDEQSVDAEPDEEMPDCEPAPQHVTGA
jgi:branched-chain amino acid transport system permease protein